MSIRGDLEQGVVGLLSALVGDGDGQFRSVAACTKADVLRMMEQELPECPFAMVSYAGRDGGFEGEHHRMVHRVSVFVGGNNLIGPEERRQEIYDLLDAVDGALMMQQPIASDGVGLLENTGESLTSLTLDGVEVWEQVYSVWMALSAG